LKIKDILQIYLLLFSKLNNLFEEEECIKMINKSINNKTLKDKIKEVIIINKISKKETEKTKSYLEIIKTIPLNDEYIFLRCYYLVYIL
jgi:hypothetical protein